MMNPVNAGLLSPVKTVKLQNRMEELRQQLFTGKISSELFKKSSLSEFKAITGEKEPAAEFAEYVEGVAKYVSPDTQWPGASPDATSTKSGGSSLPRQNLGTGKFLVGLETPAQTINPFIVGGSESEGSSEAAQRRKASGLPAGAPDAELAKREKARREMHAAEVRKKRAQVETPAGDAIDALAKKAGIQP
jgi:hypothetical protein